MPKREGSSVSDGHAYLEGDCVEAPTGTSSRIYYCVAYDIGDHFITAMRCYGPIGSMCAFWLVFRLLNAGDLPSASGWIARIERMLPDAADGSPERGHLTYLTGFQAILSRDLQTAEADLGRSVQIAERCGDLDLSTLARLALGRLLIFRGDVAGGVRLLDEAMVAVNAGELSPIVVGDSYCAAIDACHDVFDVRRGQVWTAAFSRWSLEAGQGEYRLTGHVQLRA